MSLSVSKISDGQVNVTTDNVNTTVDMESQNVIQKLNQIRLWQLMQKEELKRQQQAQIALLKSQHVQIPSPRSNDSLPNDDHDARDLGNDEDNEVLAFPLPEFPVARRLETILEQSVDNESVNNQSVNCIDQAETSQLADMAVDVDYAAVKSKPHMSLYESNDQPGDLPSGHDFVETGGSVQHFSCEMENSFEKSSSAMHFDDVPVTNVINGKTFEQVLEEQLNAEKERVSKLQTNASTPKRTFLRKGQGTARFNGPPIKPKPRKPGKIKDPPSGRKLDSLDIISSVKTKSVGSSRKPVDATVENNCISSDLSDSNREKLQAEKPVRVRKTARLARREPMKTLNLKVTPDKGVQNGLGDGEDVQPPSHLNFPQQFSSIPRPVEQDFQQQLTISVPKAIPAPSAIIASDPSNEESWSDAEDSTLALETTADAENLLSARVDPDQTETFEKIERFCNKHFSDDVNVDKEVSPQLEQENPAPNKLMQKLFPTLRPISNAQSNTLQPPDHGNDSKRFQPEFYKDHSVPEPSEQTTTLLKAKLEEMQLEIKRFQDETVALRKVRQLEEENMRQLRNEIAEFQKQKNEELKRLDEFKKTETKKLKKERKLFEEHVATLKSLPNKQDRECIQDLQEKIKEVEAESKVKEQRLAAVNNRLRSQLEASLKENALLKEKLIFWEEKAERLEKEDERRKVKKCNSVWKAINNIVDSVPMDRSEENIENIPCHLPQKTVMDIPVSADTRSTSPSRRFLAEKNDSAIKVVAHDKKCETVLPNGSVETVFHNGTKKTVSADKTTTQIKFANGDVKTTLPDGTVTYYYTASGTRHTTQPDGVQVIEFHNDQVERHFADGSKHVTFPDGSNKMIRLDGSEETTLKDGTVMKTQASGEKMIRFPNGQREIHTPEFKRREYPDGTCKTVYADGRQETKYASGRLRVKNPSGVVIVDRLLPVPKSFH